MSILKPIEQAKTENVKSFCTPKAVELVKPEAKAEASCCCSKKAEKTE